MKIFSIPQIREADAFTIAQEPIASIALMERAALACVHWLTERFESSYTFNIICGLGNNGGDGLAIARLLAARGYTVEVIVVRYSEKHSEDFESNLLRVSADSVSGRLNMVEVHSLEAFHTAFVTNAQTIIIDALFGSGLNKPVEGLVAGIISIINQSKRTVVSIDMPSGLFADLLNGAEDVIMNAHYTLSFQFPKLSFMFPETAACVGEFSILNIGLHQHYIEHTSTPYFFTTQREACLLYKKRSKSAHKGSFGHALLLAGSKGKMGAALLSAKACLRSGAGLLSVHIPECGYSILQTGLPEAMVSTDTEQDYISSLPSLERYTAIGIGPGIGTEQQTQNVLKLLIQNSSVPLVLDADALNILSENKTWLAFLPANSILTPHPKEFERLAGKCANNEERLKALREFALKNKVYVILKGAHSAIAFPDGSVHFNSSGNPGMAKGGSGDALTGILTALLAQGYTPEATCVFGVYLHGLAGDFAAHALSEESMLPSDLIEHLSDAFRFVAAAH